MTDSNAFELNRRSFWPNAGLGLPQRSAPSDLPVRVTAPVACHVSPLYFMQYSQY
jgi:hypothetical protein